MFVARDDIGCYVEENYHEIMSKLQNKLKKTLRWPDKLESFAGAYGVVLFCELQGANIALKITANYRLSPETSPKFCQYLKEKAQNLFPILQYINDEQFTYLFMPKADMDLSTYMFIQKKKIFNDAAIKKILYEVALGINELNSLNYIYNDLKPNNILLFKGKFYISDFGHAREKGDPVNSSLPIKCYKAPDYQTKYIDFKADVWALGCFAFKLSTFIDLFEENYHLTNIIVSPQLKEFFCEKLGTEGSQVVQRCLQSRPENRISMRDLLKSNYFNSLRNPTKKIEKALEKRKKEKKKNISHKWCFLCLRNLKQAKISAKNFAKHIKKFHK